MTGGAKKCSLLALVVTLALTLVASAGDSQKTTADPAGEGAFESRTTAENAYPEVRAPHDTAECSESCLNFCGCESCCGNPCWKATADALLLQRSATHGPQLLSDPATGASLLKSSNLHFSFEAGPRLSLIRQGDCGWDCELNCFGIDGWSASAAFSNTAFVGGVGSLPIDNAISLPVDEVAFAERSRLYSGEFNLRRPVGDSLVALLGFRWVELYDHYRAQGTAAVMLAPFSDTINTRNHMYGFQAGAEALLWQRQDRFRYAITLQAVAKAGIFYDAADQHAEFLDPAGIELSAGAARNGTAFLGELGLVGSYQLGNHVALRGGYQVLWIEGVALAPRQIPVTDLGLGTAAVDQSGGLFYHGANAGLEITW